MMLNRMGSAMDSYADELQFQLVQAVSADRVSA